MFTDARSAEINMLPRSDTEAMDQPTILYMLLYGECETDKPFCVRWPNINIF